ncbi:MAG TPA: CvpA family protein [Paludibacteraceae bacterium]|jgi:membrane protein required for colicin V production|nr:CvpA family protein [Paludibacteraceae bacterium]HQB69387.1 CvpA family protein [Paludibacteraceae bacterium]
MNILDIILLIPLAYGLINGLIKGLFKELASLLGIVLGIYIARLWAPYLSSWLSTWLDYSLKVLVPISYLLIFIVIAVGLNVLALMLEKLMKLVSLGWVNKLGGGAFGLLKFALILSILLNAFTMLNNHLTLVKPQTLNDSYLYTPIKKVTEYLSFDLLDETTTKLNSTPS